MTASYRTKGFVFKKTDRNESDRIFSIFTEDFGRLEITGKAIRKIASKLRAGIDIFYFSEIEFIQGKNKKTLTDAAKVQIFDNFYCDFKKLELAVRVSDVLDDFIKGQERDGKTFELIGDFFEKLDNHRTAGGNHRLLFHYFFWNFISFQGYKLEADVCAVCLGKLNPYNVYFSAREGGVICKNCVKPAEEAIKINSDIVKILRLIFNKNWQTVSILKVGMTSQNLLENVFENAIHAFSPVHS